MPILIGSILWFVRVVSGKILPDNAFVLLLTRASLRGRGGRRR